MEQGGSSLSLAWLSGIGLFCRHNSQYFARLSSLTEAAVCQLARRKNRNYLHTCLGLTNEGQESQTKCVESDWDRTNVMIPPGSNIYSAHQPSLSVRFLSYLRLCSPMTRSLPAACASSLSLTIIDCEVESYGAVRGLIYVHCWI